MKNKITRQTALPLVDRFDKFILYSPRHGRAVKGQVIETKTSNPCCCGCLLDTGELIEIDSLKVAAGKI